jgi:hypothetical protein
MFSWYSLKLTRHPQYYIVFNAVLLLKKVPLSNSMLWVLHIFPGRRGGIEMLPLNRSHESFTYPEQHVDSQGNYTVQTQRLKNANDNGTYQRATQNVMKNQLESRFFTTSKHLHWNKHCNRELSDMESCMVYISFTLNTNHCYFYIKNTTSEIPILYI